MSEISNELEQARKYGNKIHITDIAIKKVRYIEYKDLTDAQNAIMQRLAKEVLFLSQTYNDSNEVAITCDLALSEPLENEECDEKEFNRDPDKITGCCFDDFIA